MTLIALIDPNVCAAHGMCEDIAPEIFHVDDIAVVIGSGPDKLMMEAAEACPTGAIRIVNSETREQMFP
jgi:ferredoxin